MYKRQASDSLEFERAIEYRELLNSVKQVAQKQKITSSGMEDRDIVAMARDCLLYTSRCV